MFTLIYNISEFFYKVGQKLLNVWFKLTLIFVNVQHGRNFKVMNAIPVLKIHPKGKFIVGDNVIINSYALTSWIAKTKICVEEAGMLTIGDNVGINGVMICCENKITIGNYVNIGGCTRIFDTNFHNLNWEERRIEELNTKAVTVPITIEDDAFIGANCIICKGVTIGARSIIAAGSVVVKDIPADCMAGGNPCRVIKQLKDI